MRPALPETDRAFRPTIPGDATRTGRSAAARSERPAPAPSPCLIGAETDEAVADRGVLPARRFRVRRWGRRNGPGRRRTRVLMGAEQKAHWDDGIAACSNYNQLRYCADEISQFQSVGWPFIAEHTGTVEAIFAALGTGERPAPKSGSSPTANTSTPKSNTRGKKKTAPEGNLDAAKVQEI